MKKNATKKLVRTTQFLIEELARKYFSQANLKDLRVLIRLAIEFRDYLRRGNPYLRSIATAAPRGITSIIASYESEIKIKYAVESIFSGIDSFCNVSNQYGMLKGAKKSNINRRVITISSLKELFISTYKKFFNTKMFLNKCRLLLDLFKIQIVFAGIVFN